MTVLVDSQPVTEQIMWYIDMCCINNSISCSEKKTTFGTHEQTLLVWPLPLLVSLSRAYWSTFSCACLNSEVIRFVLSIILL